MSEHGLRVSISNATNDQEIDTLLAEGKTYTMASDVTRRSWMATANRRRAQLANQPAPKPIVQPEQEVEVKVKTKKKIKKLAS